MHIEELKLPCAMCDGTSTLYNRKTVMIVVSGKGHYGSANCPFCGGKGSVLASTNVAYNKFMQKYALEGFKFL